MENREVRHAAIIGAVAATPVVARFIADKKYILRGLEMVMGTAGASTTNTGVVNINGVAVTGLSVSIAGSVGNNGVRAFDAPTAETVINPGDVFDMQLTAFAGSGSPANMTASIHLVEVLEEI